MTLEDPTITRALAALQNVDRDVWPYWTAEAKSQIAGLDAKARQRVHASLAAHNDPSVRRRDDADSFVPEQLGAVIVRELGRPPADRVLTRLVSSRGDWSAIVTTEPAEHRVRRSAAVIGGQPSTASVYLPNPSGRVYVVVLVETGRLKRA